MTFPPESRLTVRVQPGASQDGIIGFRDGVLWVKVAAPPADGKANQRLVYFLGGVLGVRKSDISIERGAGGRHKAIRVRGLAQDQMMERLGKVIAR